ncbi:putative glutathione S-transferase [Idiomarina fontislapidosi]|uniref:Glutathione-dependent reductase n=1 Tax=Idiomarina fontislapidosi TaxID=263723 RepID=A0A432YBJ1_9GAMM|nr:glutathione S-transferase family protein [Idiomarina fontislapidosi]PYE35468.1 putative glutathione S-transferase [Idiomarina fontislapidosi]RUO58349.1 glutathione-dependent reductase [Idiomarina fontislapidosi]
MGLLVEGKWHDKWYDTKKHGGRFVRSESQFRNHIEQGGQFPPESGRYHLYVSYACPWAHRALIFRKLKGLESHIDVSVVHPLMLENGWEFSDAPLNDPLYQSDFMYQLYLKADPNYSGRVTVPVLWDKKTETIVNNESAEIIRIFNSAFNELTGNDLDFYPEPLREEIDSVNERVYHDINNGVYKCGFATEQTAYEEAFKALFDALDWVEERLQHQDYLVGDQLTEADWRLFTTLVRFDAVYFGHFKTNKYRIHDYPKMSGYLSRLFNHPGVADTVVMDHIKRHYYGSHKTINPTQIVPVGPELSF